MDWIILSPHLDDGIFSCGGIIARATAAGERVRVITFYTGDPDPACVRPNMEKFCDYAQRKAEDERATVALGAEHRWRPYVERAFRPPQIRGLAGAFRTPENAEAFLNLESISDEIEALLTENPEAQLLAPLGVGNHFDHVELALAALQVLLRANAFARLAFYEDAYALGTGARKQHPVTRARLWRNEDSPQRASLRSLMMFTLLGRVMEGPSSVDYLPPDTPELAWRCEPVPLIDEEKKLAAVNLYASQVELLGGPERWGAIMQRYHRFWGHGEPVWRAEPRPG